MATVTVTVTPTYRFADVRAVAAAIMGTPPERMGTLESRLKQWQKMGCPRGSHTGRGHYAEYSVGMIWEVAVMAELTNLGLTPQVAGEIIASIEQRQREALMIVRTISGRRSSIAIDLRGLGAIIGSQLGGVW